jgi:hypothetical protein
MVPMRQWLAQWLAADSKLIAARNISSNYRLAMKCRHILAGHSEALFLAAAAGAVQQRLRRVDLAVREDGQFGA